MAYLIIVIVQIHLYVKNLHLKKIFECVAYNIFKKIEILEHLIVLKSLSRK